MSVRSSVTHLYSIDRIYAHADLWPLFVLCLFLNPHSLPSQHPIWSVTTHLKYVAHLFDLFNYKTKTPYTSTLPCVKIGVTIVDDNQWEPDEEFFLKLTYIQAEDNGQLKLGRTSIMEITILNDDGKLIFFSFLKLHDCCQKHKTSKLCF